ncbi:MAG: MBL fold metallo-hydrolase [Tepidiformaceae bacterium]
MNITFCGTAAGGLAPPRAATSILLRRGDDAFLLDCGPGALWRILESGVPLRRIHSVLISHLHMDHVQGFPELLAHMVFPNGAIPSVQGPPGTSAYVERAASLTQLVSRLPGVPHYDTPLEVPVLEVGDNDERELLGLKIRAVVVPHTPELVCLARRIECEGRSLVFSGDTTPAPEIMVPLAAAANVLIHECYSNEGIEDWVNGLRPNVAENIRAAFAASHSELTRVCAIAKEAGVQRLVLTHLNPGEKADRLLATAERLFPGEVVVAQDGLGFEL